METSQQLVKNEFNYSDILLRVKQIFDLLDVSENTREEYKQRIELFLTFLKKYGLNRDSFLEFKRHLNDKVDYSVSTKNKYLATSRIFLKELNRQGILPTDITQNIKSFSQSKRHKIDGLNDEEITKLITYLQSLSDTNQNTRLKAIFSLLIFQGLRQCEITRLKYQDFDPINHTLFVVGKGRDDKELINLHPETVKNIQLFIKTNRIADGYLLASKSNHNLNNKLSVRGLREIIKIVLIELGINRNIHGFRHYFITKLIKNYKGDLLEVARYTRHRSLEMLQIYNDGISQKKDLPRYYKTFNEISF